MTLVEAIRVPILDVDAINVLIEAFVVLYRLFIVPFGENTVPEISIEPALVLV